MSYRFHRHNRRRRSRSEPPQAELKRSLHVDCWTTRCKLFRCFSLPNPHQWVVTDPRFSLDSNRDERNVTHVTDMRMANRTLTRRTRQRTIGRCEFLAHVCQAASRVLKVRMSSTSCGDASATLRDGTVASLHNVVPGRRNWIPAQFFEGLGGNRLSLIVQPFSCADRRAFPLDACSGQSMIQLGSRDI